MLYPSSKYRYYLNKGSTVPNLSFYPFKDSLLTDDNSLYCFISEENLIRITEYDCPDIIKIKCLGLLMEIKRICQTYRGEADFFRRDSNWVMLHSKILKRNYGYRDYPVVIDVLKSLELIDVDGNYSIQNKKEKKDGYSKSYRLTDRMRANRKTFLCKIYRENH